MTQPTRRTFLTNTVATAAGLTAASLLAQPTSAQSTQPAPENEKPLGLKKALGWAMIKDGATPDEKFALAKDAGFDGVEMNSPDSVNIDDVIAAARKHNITLHSVCDSIHWAKRFSDPDESVRNAGLEGLQTALRDAKQYGAETVLLVPGRVGDKEKENFDQCWQRSQSMIKKAIPTAEETGVKIAIEDVWNNFLMKPEDMAKFIDEANSPLVGSYFDIGNVVKWGIPPAAWIRTLGPRILKLHVKGYSHAKQWVKIGDGDENWPDVRKALAEINYHGWATAEVPGGNLDELKDIKKRMDQALGA